jgi:hypothetical protein
MRGRGKWWLTGGPHPAASQARKGRGGVVWLLGRRGNWARSGVLGGRPSRSSGLREKVLD